MMPGGEYEQRITNTAMSHRPMFLDSDINPRPWRISVSEPSSTAWPAAICTQLTICLVVITVNTPQFGPILRGLQSSGVNLVGMSRLDACSRMVSGTPFESSCIWKSCWERTGQHFVALRNIQLVAMRTTGAGASSI
ncbi:hypothetical protein BJX66DRAFT_68172 [Aspergillus keveii]|uniref:Uncharacterized protein n=1 Tax=Aspergillus keveii TaxID=714993 RepID=A0ABR4FPF8_9EURO